MFLSVINTFGWVMLFVNWFVEAQEKERMREAYNARGREITAFMEQLMESENASEETIQEIKEEYEEKIEVLRKELQNAELRAERDRKQSEETQVNFCIFLFMFGFLATILVWFILILSSPIVKGYIAA